MSDHDHGPYTPPSDRLAFDPRQPVRGGGPAPVTLIVSGVVLLAIIGGVFLLYRGGVRHKGEAPAAVGAPLGQIKTPAAPDTNAAGPRLVIDRSDVTNSATNAAPSFAPQAEQPLPRPLPVEATPLPPLSNEPASAPLPAKPVVITAKTPAPVKPAKPLTIASLTDAALAQKPRATPAPKPTPKPVTITPPPAAPIVAAAAPAAGAGWVQIGAYSSAALAQKGWSDTARLEPGAMAGKGQRFESVQVGGKTLYRAYVTGFSHAGAESFCGELKAAGKACFVK